MSRRNNGDGSITQRADGRWQARLQVEGRRLCAYGRTKQEARNKLAEMQRQALLTGGLPEPGHTLGSLFDYWLAAATPALKPRTLDDYTRIAALIRERLGDAPLSKVTPARLQALYASFKDHPRMALYVYQVLHRALGLAVQWNWLPANPADKTLRPGYHRREKPMWNVEQCRHFLEATEESPWWPLWTLALATGCRYGELIGLEWNDIDSQRRTARVERTCQRIGKDWVVNAPKTASGRRTIPLGDLAMRALQRQKVLQAERRLKAGPNWQDNGRTDASGRADGSARIFTNRTGGPLEKASAQQALARTCRRLELPIISPHTLRHLNASLALQGGAPIALVSRNLGHSNVAITTAVYSHAISDGRIVADALERALVV